MSKKYQSVQASGRPE